MGPIDYVVMQIDGDYAHLQQADAPGEPWKLVARALLPEEIEEGSRVHYEMFEYSLAE